MTKSSTAEHKKTSSQKVEYAGFWRRYASAIYDGIIVFFITFTLSFVFAIIGLADLAGLVGFVGGIAYVLGFWMYNDGQTPGKIIMKAKVVPEEGGSLTWPKAIIRYVGYYISAIILNLGYIWAAFDEKKQGWHDKIARTYVVSTGKPNGVVFGIGLFLGIVGPIVAIIAAAAIIIGIAAFAATGGGEGLMKLFSDEKVRTMMMSSYTCAQECQGEADVEMCTQQCITETMEEKGITPEDLQESLMDSGMMDAELEGMNGTMDEFNMEMEQMQEDLMQEMRDSGMTEEQILEMQQQFDQEFENLDTQELNGFMEEQAN